MINEQEIINELCKELEEVIASQNKEFYQIVIKKENKNSSEIDDNFTNLGNVV